MVEAFTQPTEPISRPAAAAAGACASRHGLPQRPLPPSTPRLQGAPPSDLLAAARRSGIVGGAVYDLVVALSAGQAGAVLLSLDRRATATDEVAGAGYELLS
ncbi:hypothetical protein [Pseudonocardia sp.]|uniref:hypothetical protein n=1 Tax=Pseudonocardia sp. TaxID=60912 RepID=UPI0031FBC323